MLKQIHVKNFRCLRDLTVDFEPLTVLIGKNDTGKSTVLAAIEKAEAQMARYGALIADDVTAGRSTELVELETKHVVTLGRGSVHEVRYAVAVHGDSVITANRELLSCRAANVFCEVGPHQRMMMSDGSQRRELDAPVMPIATFAAAQGWVPIVELAQAIRGSQLVRLNARALAASGPIIDGTEQVPQLEVTGAGLVALLDYLLGADRDAFYAIEADIAKLMPSVRRLRLYPTRVTSRVGASEPGKMIAIETSDGAVVPASAVSDGVLLVLAFLTLARSPSRPRIILLEEPENGLHPKLLQHVTKVLTDITENATGKMGTQVILTTHSPYLLDSVPAESVRVFHRERGTGDVRVKRFTELSNYASWREDGASLGEMWFNAGEEALFDDANAGGE